MIVHSYIGQQPVYSEALKCHIFPTPDYVIPGQSKPFYPGKNKPKKSYALRKNECRESVVALLETEGPLTIKMVATRLNLEVARVKDYFHNNTGGMFVKIGVVTIGAYYSTLWGVKGQTPDDVKCSYELDNLRTMVTNSLKVLKSARSEEIASVLNISRERVSSCLSRNKDRFVSECTSDNSLVWRLKEAA